MIKFLTLLVVFTYVQVALGSPMRIMALGDSITYGTSSPGSYRVRLQELLLARGILFQYVGSVESGPPSLLSLANEGHGGWKIDDIAKGVPFWLTQSQPDIVLLLIGTNDIWVREINDPLPDVAAILAKMKNLIELIFKTSPRVKLVVGSVPFTSYWWNSYVLAYDASLMDLVAQEASLHPNIQFVDIYSTLTISDLVDGVHPTSDGFKKMAEAWIRSF